MPSSVLSDITTYLAAGKNFSGCRRGESFNMKRTTLSKFVGAGVLSMGLAMGTLAMPSYAQTGSGTGTGTGTDTTTGTTQTTVDNTQQGDRDFDWGWLGLLGLLGLAGLAKKTNHEPTRYREPGEVNTGTGTGTRY
ncbi:MAG TPA: WGxxGxxG family protein [Oculatellaceae cyanobacterium]|jgi:hypothetical protein